MSATHPALEDTQVQAAIAAGDYKRALELVAYTYLDLVFGYCFRVLNGDTSRAKDVTQQVFEEVCRGLARYRAESSVKTWLLATAPLSMGADRRGDVFHRWGFSPLAAHGYVAARRGL